MTKMKSKKMSKSTFAVIIMAIAMVAMLAFGGTYAFFTSSIEGAISSGNVTTGHVELGLGSNKTITKAFDASYAVPGDTLWNVSLDLVNKSNVKTYVFAKWTLTNEDAIELTVTPPAGDWTQLKTDGESPTDVAGVFYAELVAGTVDNATTSITFTSAVVFATTNGNTTMDKTVSCSVSFSQAQFDHLTPYAAYTASIGA